jgi:hypothetical protein
MPIKPLLEIRKMNREPAIPPGMKPRAPLKAFTALFHGLRNYSSLLTGCGYKKTTPIVF